MYAQRSNSGVRGPPSAVRAVLTEPQAEQATHASFPVKPSNTAGDTGRDPKPHALYGEGGRGRFSERGDTRHGQNSLDLLHQRRVSEGRWNMARLNRHSRFSYSKNSNPRCRLHAYRG